jgi:glutaconyl-CoA/methylmalonyl-CoA decarboxylase subunit gamma
MKKFSFSINGNEYDVEIKSVDDSFAEVEVNGFVYEVQFDRSIPSTKTPTLVRSASIPSTSQSPTKTSPPDAPKGAGFIKSPLPGVILDVFVKVGDTVRFGDKLIALEAMKMENVINSDKDGQIVAIKVAKGSNVMEGDILLEIGN